MKEFYGMRRNEISRQVIDEVDEKVSRIRRRRGVAVKTALIRDIM